MNERSENGTTSGAPSARSMATSLAIHAVAMLLVLLIPAEALSRSDRRKELEVVFYRPHAPIPAAAIPPPPSRLPSAPAPKPGGPAPPPAPKPPAPGPGKPNLPEGPKENAPAPQAAPKPQVGNLGILALKEKFASLREDTVGERLGKDAHFSDAQNAGRPSSHSVLTTNTPGSSGGINLAALNREVGGGGGGNGPGGNNGTGLQGVQVGRATSSIAGIGGGDRPVAHSGPGPARTDEEIQIVFDRYKAAFYRQYNRALRNDPTLKGQMVLRLTIEPDGRVSMCKLQSSDMNAPDLAAQVVTIVLTIDFGAKEGVQALTISYPIDFLPAE